MGEGFCNKFLENSRLGMAGGRDLGLVFRVNLHFRVLTGGLLYLLPCSGHDDPSVLLPLSLGDSELRHSRRINPALTPSSASEDAPSEYAPRKGLSFPRFNLPLSLSSNSFNPFVLANSTSSVFGGRENSSS